MTEKKEAKKEVEKNYFEVLNNINVKDKIEKKNKLSYLSWAYAWGEIKKIHPDVSYTVYETPTGCIYHTDGRTCWVKTGVKVNDIEHIEYLPVMDFSNKAIGLDKITSFDVNKAIQRSVTKAISRHGLGLYIYAGEDLPEEEKEAGNAKNESDKVDPKNSALNSLGNSMMSSVDRLTQEQMRNSALTLLNACATPDKLKEIWVKNYKAWGKLDKDLFIEIETCKDHNKKELESVA